MLDIYVFFVHVSVLQAYLLLRKQMPVFQNLIFGSETGFALLQKIASQSGLAVLLVLAVSALHEPASMLVSMPQAAL